MTSIIVLFIKKYYQIKPLIPDDYSQKCFSDIAPSAAPFTPIPRNVSELKNIDLANAGGHVRSKCSGLSAFIAISNNSETFSRQFVQGSGSSFYK
jgi:hypothetical protein